MRVTLKFQSTGTIPGEGKPITMRGPSLTVGRGPENDLVLPDPDRLISKTHCVIEDHNGNVLIVDFSTNGTFLNYSKIPIGKIPTPLNDGDILALGTYEFAVDIKAKIPSPTDTIADPVDEGQVSHGVAENAPNPLGLLDDANPDGDFLDDLLGGTEKPVGPSQLKHEDPINELLPPLGEEQDPFFNEPTDTYQDMGASQATHNPSQVDSFSPATATSNVIPDDWNFTEGEKDPPDPISHKQADVPDVPLSVERVEPSVRFDATSSERPAVRAFLKSVGAEELNIADEDLEPMMVRMGSVMKAMITGLREILMTRSSIKSEFRIDQTMIGAGSNNPLKFSISPEQAIEAMIKPRTRGYLEAGEATYQALNDIKAHEIAMVTGMEAALKGVLEKLNPVELVEKLEAGGSVGSILKGKKARYWEVYEKMYADISDQAENDFHDLFSKEFARAYKQQLEQLK